MPRSTTGSTTRPSTMRAAAIDRLGGPDLIRVRELPIPDLGPTDVLVRVEATAVNHVDTFVRSGAYATPTPFPFVVGRDLVGTVVEAGPGAQTAVGSRVWCNTLGHGGRQGAAAELAVVAADRVHPLPADADATRSVALLHPVATAHLAVVTHGRTRPGDTVLVLGAAGHVGRAATRVAADQGARVVATASPDGFAAARAAGADVVLDYHDPELPRRLADACPDGVDVHLDTAGHHDLDLAVRLLAPRGRIVLLAGMGATPPLPVGPLYTKDGTVTGFAISNATPDELADAARSVDALLRDPGYDAGRLDVRALAAAAQAHADLESGAVRGARVVLVP